MAEQTLSDLCASAEQAITQRDFDRALSLYTAALQAQPDHLDARLRLADCLLALGQVQRAALVYTTLARHAAHLGHPLRAIVAIKILSTLDPALSALVDALAALYAADGGRVGRSVRTLPPSEDLALSDAVRATLLLRGEALCAQAEAVGGDLTHCARAYPSILPPIPLLSLLTRADFVAALGTVSLVRLRPGERALTQGEPGGSFFLVARGDFEVAREAAEGARQVLASLHEGAIFGEMALVSRSARTAHVDAVSSGDVLELGVEALSRLSDGQSAIARALFRFTRERLVMNLITTAPLFRPLDHAQRLDLVRRFVAHDVAAQTDIIREGERVPGLYVLLDGSVDVWKRDGTEKVLLATLSGGDVFGEISLLNDSVATASVTAATRSTVLLLAREYVERVVQRVPALREYLEGLGDERAMDTRMWLDAGAVSAQGEELPLEIDVDLVLDDAAP